MFHTESGIAQLSRVFRFFTHVLSRLQEHKAVAEGHQERGTAAENAAMVRRSALRQANDRSLSDADLKTVVAWVDAGAPEGDPRKAPAALKRIDRLNIGWNIGQPDIEFEIPYAYHIPASGTIENRYVLIPTGFTEDRWVRMTQSAPGREVHWGQQT